MTCFAVRQTCDLPRLWPQRYFFLLWLPHLWSGYSATYQVLSFWALNEETPSTTHVVSPHISGTSILVIHWMFGFLLKMWPFWQKHHFLGPQFLLMTKWDVCRHCLLEWTLPGVAHARPIFTDALVPSMSNSHQQAIPGKNFPSARSQAPWEMGLETGSQMTSVCQSKEGDSVSTSTGRPGFPKAGPPRLLAPTPQGPMSIWF